MLEQYDTKVEEERNSRKQPLDDTAAQALLSSVEAVWVAKGKKVRQLSADETSLDDLKGPTGNYRAPMVRSGSRLLVGFHPETLEELLQSS